MLAENSIRQKRPELLRVRRVTVGGVLSLFWAVLGTARSLFRRQLELALENLARSQQVAVLIRTRGGRRPRLGVWVRAFWVHVARQPLRTSTRSTYIDSSVRARPRQGGAGAASRQPPCEILDEEASGAEWVADVRVVWYINQMARGRVRADGIQPSAGALVSRSGHSDEPRARDSAIAVAFEREARKYSGAKLPIHYERNA